MSPSHRIWLVRLFLGAALLLLGGFVVSEKRRGKAPALDVRAQYLGYGLRDAPLEAVGKLLHYAGNAIGVAVVALALAGFLWWRNDRRGAAQVALLFALLGTILIALKEGIGRERPDATRRVVPEEGGSFPSGHAAGASALALVGIAVSRRRLSLARDRRVAVIALLGYALIMGLSRVFLGVHYLSDVIAGWVLGALSFASVWEPSPTL